MKDDLCLSLISETGTQEARIWLNGNSPAERRNIGEMDVSQSKDFVENLYDGGAEFVYAVKIKKNFLGPGESTNTIVVKLPDDNIKRRELFSIEKKHAAAMGFDEAGDTSQNYILFYWS